MSDKKPPIQYFEDFLKPEEAEQVAKKIWEGTQWERRETAPRREYWINPYGLAYTYGSAEKARTYEGHHWRDSITGIIAMALIERMALLRMKAEELPDCCFLNGYENDLDHLGWHSDDSPEMSHDHPIAVVSLGAVRELWVKPKSFKGVVPPEWRFPLASGSLLIMGAGMQRDWFHRIPKGDKPCGFRVSLTYRRLVRGR